MSRITDPDDFFQLEEMYAWEAHSIESKVELLRRLLEDVIYYLAKHEQKKT